MRYKHFTFTVLVSALSIWILGRDPPFSGGFDQGPEKSSAKAPNYQDHIRPLFQAKCFRCHGDKVRKADLDLMTHTSVLKGGESGAVVVPGKPEESLLYEKVHAGIMPPGTKDRLS